MTRKELATASKELASAAEQTDSSDASERLADLADQLERLSTADRGPDHGRLARIQSALNELKRGDGADVTETIDEANDAINGFRSDLEGV